MRWALLFAGGVGYASGVMKVRQSPLSALLRRLLVLPVAFYATRLIAASGGARDGERLLGAADFGA